MAQLFHFLYFVVYFYCAVGRIAILPDEGIENCAKPEERADYFDLDKLEVIVESDYDVFLNGTFRFNKEIKSWNAHFYTEEFYRNEWTRRLVDRKVADFCKVIHSPTELWYNQMKKQPGCPIKAGVNFYRLLIEHLILYFETLG